MNMFEAPKIQVIVTVLSDDLGSDEFPPGFLDTIGENCIGFTDLS